MRLRFNRLDYAAFFIFFAYAAGSLVIPVALVDIAKELDFSLKKGGMNMGGALHIARSVSLVMTMIFSGFVASKFGLKRALGGAVVLMAAGLVLCGFSMSFSVLLMALLIAGFGEGVIEGLATPFIQHNHPKDSARYINFTHSFWSIGVFVTVLFSGIVMVENVSWRVPIFVAAAVSLLGLFILISSKRQNYHTASFKETKGEYLGILRSPQFWWFFAAMFFAGGAEFGVTFWVASYVQIDLGTSVLDGAYATAIFAAGMFIGRILCGVYIQQDKLRTVLVLVSLAGVLVNSFLPNIQDLGTLFFILFLSGLTAAPLWASLQSFCADCLPRFDTTPLFILLSCAGIPGCGFVTWLMGYVSSESSSLRMAFYIVPVCFALVALIIFFKLKKKPVGEFKNWEETSSCRMGTQINFTTD